MVKITKSAKNYQERRQPEYQPTQRAPGLQFAPQENMVHKLTLEPPFPSPDLTQKNSTGPDSAGTQVWPYGDEFSG